MALRFQKTRTCPADCRARNRESAAYAAGGTSCARSPTRALCCPVVSDATMNASRNELPARPTVRVIGESIAPDICRPDSGLRSPGFADAPDQTVLLELLQVCEHALARQRQKIGHEI